MKVVIYTRVNTGDQDTANLLRVLTDWANLRGFEVFKIYEEEESAWKAGHQKKLSALIADARMRRFQAVLVWSLDRLSREGVRCPGNIKPVAEILCLWSKSAFIPGELDGNSGRNR